MSIIGVGGRHGAKNTDYDAAQALLDLQSNINPEGIVGTYASWRDTDSKEDIEKAAKLILSCFISSDVPDKNNFHGRRDGKNTQLPPSVASSVLLNTTQNRNRVSGPQKECKQSRSHGRNVGKRISSNKHSPLYIEADLETTSTTERKRYHDAETQTEEKYFNSNIQLMETTIKNLCDRIKSLEAQLKTSLDPSMGEASYETADLDVSYENHEEDPDFEMAVDSMDTTNEFKRIRTSEFDSSVSDSHNRQTNKNVLYNGGGVLTNHNKSSYEMVPIGDGNATVPSRLLKQINWNSYSSATRKLLTAVFSRRILATHSLTGKPSPAFPNKPAKKRLDQSLVNDIVQTVVERCRVPENVVRTSITTKCADESKMYRTREKNKKKRSNLHNRENVSPSDSESDDY